MWEAQNICTDGANMGPLWVYLGFEINISKIFIDLFCFYYANILLSAFHHK